MVYPEAGRVYKRTDGRLTGVIERTRNGIYPFYDPLNDEVYTHEGRIWVTHTSDADLMSDYTFEQTLDYHLETYSATH